MLNLSNDRDLIREGMARKRLRRQARKQTRRDSRLTKRTRDQPTPAATESSPWELLVEQGVVAADDPTPTTATSAGAKRPAKAPQSNDRTAPPLWVPLEGRPAEPTGRRVGRIALWTALGLVMALGLVTLARSAVNFFTPSPQQTVASIAPGTGSEDLELSGTAERVALDYLTWSEDSRPWRSAAMAWTGLPGSSSDGWNGRGSATATAATTLGVDHVTDSLSVATVEVRVQTPTPVTPNGTSAIASTPNALWLTLAVPLTRSDGGLSVAATPALVGAPPPSPIKAQPVSPTVDSEASTATRASATRLLTSYAASDLTYVLAPGAEIAGLNGVVVLQELTDWSVDQLTDGSDPSVRRATATVRWQLPGGTESQLLSTYRVEIRQIDGRWLLSSISPRTEK